MRLKSLRLAGFKSFANSTTFNFTQNITAIVGPNGCGKSNVIDAIRWVLGESSAKQLRGGAMSDVIFAGTQDKSAKSLASVELTFEHTQDEKTGIHHELNVYHELSIRRQVNREGKSDYFINGTRCRRRDVIDIFLGTGLGARSYAVIEQGMIGRIVDSSPMQLREFIEEGAGVSRYQARRLETHKKLSLSQENLSRLNDLKTELEKQQRTLTRQAETAKKYQGLKNKLNELEQEIAIYQLHHSKHNEQQNLQQYSVLHEALLVTEKKLDEQNVNFNKATSRIAEQQWLKDDARDKYHAQQLTLQNLEHGKQQQQTQIKQLTDKQASLREQEKDNRNQHQQLVTNQQSARQQLTTLEPILNKLQQQKADNEKIRQPLEKQWQELHNEGEGLQNQQRNLEKQQALAEQAIKQLQNQRNRWQIQQTHWQKNWHTLTEENDLEQLNQQLSDYSHQLSHAKNQYEDISIELAEKQSYLTITNAQVDETQQARQQLEKKHATLNSEYNTLHALVHPKKKLIKNSSSINSQPNAVTEVHLHLRQLSDSIELTEQGLLYADMLDNWLAMLLDSLVNRDTENKKAGDVNLDADVYQLLQQHKPASNLKTVLNLASSKDTNNSNDMSIDDMPINDIPINDKQLQCIAVSQLIKTPKLKLWQSTYLVIIDNQLLTQTEQSKQSLPQLLTLLQAKLPAHSLLITNTGWMVADFGMMHLSKLSNNSGDSHFLQQREIQRTRLAELEEQLDSLEIELEVQQDTLKAKQLNYDEQKIIAEELTAQRNNLQQQIYKQQQTITELNAKLNQQNADSERLEQEKKQLATDKLNLDNEIDRLNELLSQLNANLPTINHQLRAIDNQRNQLNEQRQKIDNQARQLDKQWQTTQLQHSQLDIGLQHSNEQIHNLDRQLTRYQQQQQELNEQVVTINAQLPDLEQQLKHQQVVSHEQQTSLQEYQAQLDQLQQDYQHKQEARNQIQRNVAEQQQHLAQINTQLAIAKERLNEACARVDTFKSLNSSSLIAKFIINGRFDLAKEEQQQQSRQQQYQDLQKGINNMGAVNLVAVEELKQINERLEPLTEQTNDIMQSIEKLTDAIHTIDNKTKNLFLQTLDSVNKELLYLFSKVFGGGQAQLTLTKDSSLAKKDTWRAGLELMAQPKGKKNARLAVLSGGEKTLTALSLVFAIFKQHPAPFCVLDEVDAPLDDANVGRFTGLIEELASDLQFIFISHNKLSMQIADELKGITMPEAGVSCLVNVNLDEAQKYIEDSKYIQDSKYIEKSN